MFRWNEVYRVFYHKHDTFVKVTFLSFLTVFDACYFCFNSLLQMVLLAPFLEPSFHLLWHESELHRESVLTRTQTHYHFRDWWYLQTHPRGYRTFIFLSSSNEHWPVRWFYFPLWPDKDSHQSRRFHSSCDGISGGLALAHSQNKRNMALHT